MTVRNDPSLRSPKAFARYRALVEEANATPTIIRSDFDHTEAQMTWDVLTAFEARVFGIDPSLVNALVCAYVRYTDMNGETDLEYEEYRDEERSAFPEYFKAECHYSLDAAVGFMTDACGLPFEQALMWVCRYQVQLRRSGLFYTDDAPLQVWLSDAPR